MERFTNSVLWVLWAARDELVIIGCKSLVRYASLHNRSRSYVRV
jgi:hypothetical protein